MSAMLAVAEPLPVLSAATNRRFPAPVAVIFSEGQVGAHVRPGNISLCTAVIVPLSPTIVRVRLTDLLCAGLLESVTINVSAMALAVAVGVPLIAPVAAFKVRPAGSVPLVKDQV
jgi:hypothetical protein